ncbi:MAG TPA: ATP-binding protein [Kiloniellales bacterium]|nr:ATP-binding protein [Kiloniellales bacterium]
MTGNAPLPAERLCWRCPAESFRFATTDELEDIGEVIGQARAVSAIRFGLGMRRPGYNLFALGPEGIGKHTVIRRFLEERAHDGPLPLDWCYVSNFKDSRKPRALSLNAGRGAIFKNDMARFVGDLRHALRSAFESEEYRTRREVLEEEYKERQEEALNEIEEEAKAKGIALLRTPVGFAFAPVQNGKVIPPEVFQRMPEEERKRIESEIEALQRRLHRVLQQAPLLIKELRDRVRALSHETATFTVGHLIKELRDRYADVPEIVRYLDEMQTDVVENVEAIVGASEQPRPDGVVDAESGHPILRRYQVNLIVDNGAQAHAPIVYEDDPSYDRLRGRVEHRAEMGALLTDFNMIRDGALHRANGGYLILDARKVLTRPMAWEGLKQTLMAGEIRIEPLAQALGLLSTVTLEPQPIPLDLKVVLVGERMLYYLLCELDPEFERLFKVAADFDERIDRDDDNNLLYARLIATLARTNGLKPFGRDAVAQVLEQSARRAGDSAKLSTNIEGLGDLLREADYCAGEAGRAAVTAEDVRQAADARIHRLDRMRELIQEEMRRGTIVIDTDGAVVGQINGLAYAQLGGFAFGRPSRITARVKLGRGEVIDIEREVELGGPLHSKGVLILAGYLSAHYSAERPLSLGASLVFEQSYGGVEGDSASSAELYALLSAVAQVPLRQSLAVTGSVNQRGEVQAIGGVNEKIEGFFDLCDARGLTGEQGVLIPQSNVKHLMLHRRVIDAVEAGRFHIYPVETIDQGLEILTGLPAGSRAADGTFPEGTFNRTVEDRLARLAEARRAFALPVEALERQK